MKAGSLAISVVIPSKNRAVMLADCFEGLAAQTLPADRFEVVLIDNRSTDDLQAVAERARRDGRLTVKFSRSAGDHGPASARNLGVSLASGRIIAFTDSDCRPDPHWLERALAAFDADPALAMATGPVLPKPEDEWHLTSKLTFINRTEHPSFPTANAMYRRSVFDAHGGFDDTLSYFDPLNRATECADTDLAWRVIKSGGNRRFLPEAIMFHCVERQSLVYWLLEPSRLFVLPALVRNHPELRRELLCARLFFYAPAWIVYGCVALAIAAVAWQPWLLLPLVAVVLARGLQRAGPHPAALAAFAGRAMLNLPRMLIMTLSLLYGSIRFRCLVL